VVQFLDFTTKDVGEGIAIEQVRVAADSEMAGRTIREMQLRKEVGVIVLAIRSSDGEMVFNPLPDAPVRGSDYLIVMGRPENLRALESLLAGTRTRG
jgi:uncharacterized protein with PhoU and TrkA domain